MLPSRFPSIGPWTRDVAGRGGAGRGGEGVGRGGSGTVWRVQRQGHEGLKLEAGTPPHPLLLLLRVPEEVGWLVGWF